MTSIKRVLGLGLVAGSVLLSGLAIASGYGSDHDDDSNERAAKMQQRMDKRMGELKASLAITAAQDGAWKQFEAAMKPPAQARQSKEARQAKRDAMKAMTTPERLAAHDAMKQQRDSKMKARTDATLAFYAQLSPAQQQSFDAASTKMMGGKRDGKHGGKHHD